MPLSDRLHALRQTCAIAHPSSHARTIPTGLSDLDLALPSRGLSCAGIHEWLPLRVPRDSVAADPRATGCRGSERQPVRVPRHSVAVSSSSSSSSSSRTWSPPLTILSHLATQSLIIAERTTGTPATLLWIGRAVWPYAHSIALRALDASLFIHATRPADRLWAADLAIRSRIAAAVVLDASGFDLASTRRLQLAAESASACRDSGTLCLLTRPPWELSILSAATTRWSVSPVVSPNHARRWSVELLRCKGVRPTDHALSPPGERVWTLEQPHATSPAKSALALVPDALHRSRAPQAHADSAPIRHTA